MPQGESKGDPRIMHPAILSGSALREAVSLQMNRHLCDGAERQKDNGLIWVQLCPLSWAAGSGKLPYWYQGQLVVNTPNIASVPPPKHSRIG